MKICIIYHSETGNTRHVAQHVALECGAERLLEVLDRTEYNRFTKFISRCSKSRGEETVPISPASIDIAPYDTIVLGSPVWAFKPTPVIHSAIAALKGYTGQPVIGFFTHGGMPGTSEETFTRWCEQRWFKVAGTMAINAKGIEDEKNTRELVALIKAAG
ncbi:MAG: flavodoxin [Methanoregula sp. PtaU1.Bin051]|nr:MAG: flavodoxin [Methanoregula sp. PtaU1.Bin051]